MTNAVFSFLKKKVMMKLIAAIVIDRQSSNVSLLISMITEKMIAMLAILTVSRNALIIFDLRSLGINGLSNATNKKQGRKMPIVADKAPPTPASCHPIKVAEENTGPGVN